MSGEIPVDGVVDILRELELSRITGRLRFTAEAEEGSQTGEVELIAGQIALDQDPLPDGSDPVERLLGLRSGLFVVHARLPPLPVSQGDDTHRKGSLAVHVPADLMNYCETVGLTGLLRFTREGEVVELVYEAGELLAIRVDGREDGTFDHVFGWDEGHFRIEIDRKAPTLVPEMTLDDEPSVVGHEDEPGAREPTTQFVRPKRPDDTGRHFLRVVEVALTDVVAQSEKARGGGARTSPPRGKMPTARPRPASMPAPPTRPRREPTVRVVYLRPDDPTTAVPASPPSKTMHVQRGSVADESLPEASAERLGLADAKAEARRRAAAPKSTRPQPSPKSAMTEDRKTPPPGPGDYHRATAPVGDIAAAIGWVMAVLVLGCAIVALLARLPPVH